MAGGDGGVQGRAAKERWEEGEKWEEGEGGIKNVEIQIVKNREIKLPAASRNFEKVPPDANVI